MHLRGLVARERRKERVAREHLDARELAESAPVGIFVVSVAMPYAQPSLALRCFHVAHVAEAIGAVLVCGGGGDACSVHKFINISQ